MTRWVKHYVKSIPEGETPYVVDDSIYKRFDQRTNLTVGRRNANEQIRTAVKGLLDVRAKRAQSGKSGFSQADYALFTSAGVMATRNGTAMNHTNRGLTSWTSLGAKLLPGLERWEGSPEESTRMVKRVARFFGADRVGIAPLDHRWIFSHAAWADGSHKEIIFREQDAPVENEEQLVIPEKMRWVIVMANWMNPNVIAYTPSPTGTAETHRTYSRMAYQVTGMAEFLRSLGYHAIPSLNGLGFNIPIAIDAGLGEQGRNGKLIHPEFGPSLRICKVITDLPLVRDRPIRFGAKEFCESCNKCAQHCPARAIPTEGPTWEVPGDYNHPGVFKWHMDNESCVIYRAKSFATNCAVCIRTCPFTKGSHWIHNIPRFSISHFPSLNGFWRNLDDRLGYGKQLDAERFWRESLE
jgi:reductive dehalogenase